MLTPNPLVWAGALTQVVRRAKIALLRPGSASQQPRSRRRGGGDAGHDQRGPHHRPVPARRAERAAHLRVVTIRPMREARPGGDRAHPEGLDRAGTVRLGGQASSLRLGLHLATALSETPPDGVRIWQQSGLGPLRCAARLGLAISFAPVEQVARAVASYRAEAEKVGWSPTPDHVLYRAVAQVSESDAAPSPRAARQFRPFFVGGPKSVIGQVESSRKAGVGVIDMAFAAHRTRPSPGLGRHPGRSGVARCARCEC